LMDYTIEISQVNSYPRQEVAIEVGSTGQKKGF